MQVEAASYFVLHPLFVVSSTSDSVFRKTFEVRMMSKEKQWGVMPEAATLRRLKAEGKTYKEIAAEYGVTESGAWRAFDRAGLIKTRMSYRDVAPWQIDRKHARTTIMQHLRTMAKLQGNQEVSSSDQTSLNSWLQYLEENNLVVAYSVDTPPNEASPSIGGFSYLPRNDFDESIFRS